MTVRSPLVHQRLARPLIALLLTLPWLLLPGCGTDKEPPKKDSDTASKPSKTIQDEKISPTRRMISRQAGSTGVASCRLRAAVWLLEQEPDHLEANRLLAVLLNTQGRRWEASTHTFKLLQLGSFAIQDLILLASPEETYQDLPIVEAALELYPEDPRPATGLFDEYRHLHRDKEMLRLLRRIVSDFPNYAEGQATGPKTLGHESRPRVSTMASKSACVVRSSSTRLDSVRHLGRSTRSTAGGGPLFLGNAPSSSQ